MRQFEFKVFDIDEVKMEEERFLKKMFCNVKLIAAWKVLIE